MKKFQLVRNGDRTEVSIRDRRTAKPLPVPEAIARLFSDRSPFNWGPGKEDKVPLAYAMLMECGISSVLIHEVCEDFAAKFLALLPRQACEVLAEVVIAWTSGYTSAMVRSAAEFACLLFESVDTV